MSNVLVVFESKYGQCEKIARHLVEVAAARGHTARALPAKLAVDAALEERYLVIVVAAVYGGRHGKVATWFVRKRAGVLNARPTAFVSVSGSAGSPIPEKQAEARRIAEAMLAETGWRPRWTLTVGGAIAYPRYNPLLRLFMKWIVGREGGPTDTTKIHESTDWAALDEEAARILDAIEGGGARERRPQHVVDLNA